MASVTKAKSVFAEEANNIAGMIERELVTGAPSYPLKRIPQAMYDTKKGHNPRVVRFETVPPARTAYQPMIVTGNEAKTFTNPLGGADISGFGDKQGPGELQAEIIRGGYTEYTRCLRGTALETEPYDVVDLIEKKAAGSLIAKLREDMPRYAKEHFANELLLQVVKNSKWKFSVAPGMPRAVGGVNFPCIPTGGPDIGTIRYAENLLRGEGWDKGSDTPLVNGRPAIQVYMGRDSIEFAIINRKKQFALDLNSSLRVDDKTFGTTEVFEGIQFLENPQPPRGYIVQTAASQYEFREISPWIVKAGTEGIVKDINPDYYASYVTVGGVAYIVMEIGFIIHPRAMERQAMGAIPSIGGKTFKSMFNFEVSLVEDWAIQADPRLNKDKRYIQYRMTHAYAPLVQNPELMSAFVYIAPTPQQYIQVPNAALVTAASQPLNKAEFPNPRDLPTPAAITEPLSRADVNTGCDPFPTDASPAGELQFAQIAYAPDESAGTVTFYVQRVSGSTGTAGCTWTTADGTAAAGTEFGTNASTTQPTGTLAWAAGELGIKTFTVPLLSTGGDDTGKTFTCTLSSATGTPGTVTLTSGKTVATVTLKDADAA